MSEQWDTYTGPLVPFVRNEIARLETIVQLQFKIDNVIVSCKRGCDHCCHLYASITIVDAIYVAELLCERPDAREVAARLKSRAEQMIAPDVDNKTWFARHVPCVFLENNECAIYERRPVPCRFHYVITPPEDCAVTAPRDVKIGTVDLHACDEIFYNLSLHLHNESPDIWGGLSCGPIPYMVLFAMKKLALGEDKAWMQQLWKDLPEPETWTRANIARLAAARRQGAPVPAKRGNRKR